MTEQGREYMTDKEVTAENIPNLDQTVIQALDFFIANPPPSLDVNKFKKPFVVGSGNAFNTGLLLFSGGNAIFADESDFKEKIEAYKEEIRTGLIRDAVVISASGEKDSVWEIEWAKKHGLRTTLLTTKAESSAAQIADEKKTYKSIPEPYTYNTSTYMGMLLSGTGENPQKIKEDIESLRLPAEFADYKSYSFVVPDKFKNICPMLDIKDGELFGPHSLIRAFPQGHARHAKFVIRTEDELVITLGQKNEFFGDPNHRWDINLPEGIDSAGIMAMTYYIVGKIQASKPPYFKENITRYANEDGPKAYGSTKPFEIIVPGSES